MLDAKLTAPLPQNEPVKTYAVGTTERSELKAELDRLSGQCLELPMVINGKDVWTGNIVDVHSPHRLSLCLAKAHEGTEEHVRDAINSALRAHRDWAAMPWTARASIFLRAAELARTTFRSRLNAATMLGQSKTAHQAEIDSACELIDFLQFNVHFAERIHSEQPLSSAGIWNALEPRPLEGFIFAATPFNFTAIAMNLPAAPALLGNTVVWKPSNNALYSARFIMDLFREAGLPPGVINLVMGSPEGIANQCIDHPDFAGVHFTGSTAVFKSMWRRIGNNIEKYKNYPRIVGETGGKDFVFAHPSANVGALATALVRGAFEYQGQKCSAASRAYIPQSLWPSLKKQLIDRIGTLRVGDVADFRNFMGAVIDARAFTRLRDRIAQAKADPSCTILAGGTCSDEIGYFVHPTLIETSAPEHALMKEELFGPVLTVWTYADSDLDKALELCDRSTPYALTGALFAEDRAFLEHALSALRYSAGNIYLNDKPTGAVVGQQPFGGGRASGTNDKAGSALNLYRWISPRTLKETFVPPTDIGYPFMQAE